MILKSIFFGVSNNLASKKYTGHGHPVLQKPRSGFPFPCKIFSIYIYIYDIQSSLTHTLKPDKQKASLSLSLSHHGKQE